MSAMMHCRTDAGLKFYAEPQPYGTRSHVARAASMVLECRQFFNPQTVKMQGETMGFARQHGEHYVRQAFVGVEPGTPSISGCR